MNPTVMIAGGIGLILMVGAVAFMVRFSPRVNIPGWRIMFVVVLGVAVALAVVLNLVSSSSGGRP